MLATLGEWAKGSGRGHANRNRRAVNLSLYMAARSQCVALHGLEGQNAIPHGAGAITNEMLQNLIGNTGLLSMLVEMLRREMFYVCMEDYTPLFSADHITEELQNVEDDYTSLRYLLRDNITCQSLDDGGWFSMFRGEAMELAQAYAHCPARLTVLLHTLSNANQTNNGKLQLFQGTIANRYGLDRSTVCREIQALTTGEDSPLVKIGKDNGRAAVWVQVAKPSLFMAATLKQDANGRLGNNPKHRESDAALLALVETWNRTIAERGLSETVRANANVVRAWRNCWKDETLRPILSNPEWVCYEFANASACRDPGKTSKMNTLPYLLGKVNNEWKIERLANGKYRDRGREGYRGAKRYGRYNQGTQVSDIYRELT